MRVGFSGCQCSGKTTQARLLAEKNKFTLVQSPARAVAELGVPVNRQGSLSSQIMISGQMEKELFITRHIENVVFERTHVDILAYAAECSLCGLNQQYFDVAYCLAEKMLNDLDIVFFFPAYDISNFIGEKADGIRDIDPSYRKSIAERVKVMLKDLRPDYKTVPEGTTDYVHEWIYGQITQETAHRVEVRFLDTASSFF